VRVLRSVFTDIRDNQKQKRIGRIDNKLNAEVLFKNSVEAIYSGLILNIAQGMRR
jgi:hypothetical protein